jgi:hypothetical protein
LKYEFCVVRRFSLGTVPKPGHQLLSAFKLSTLSGIVIESSDYLCRSFGW